MPCPTCALPLCTQALTLPLDTAKVRLQVQTAGGKYKSVDRSVPCRDHALGRALSPSHEGHALHWVMTALSSLPGMSASHTLAPISCGLQPCMPAGRCSLATCLLSCTLHRGLLGTIGTIAREEGAASLWKGIEPGED